MQAAAQLARGQVKASSCIPTTFILGCVYILLANNIKSCTIAALALQEAKQRAAKYVVRASFSLDSTSST
jgi:uncharacterized membrane protein (DUF485 family)